MKQIMFMPTPNAGLQPLQLRKRLLSMHKLTPIHMAAIEDVHSMFGMTARSNFQFGFNVGLLHGIIRTTEIGLELIQPKVWQKATGVVIPPKSKSAEIKKLVAQVAMRLYPQAELYGPQGGLLDGRADALMIAHYLSLKYGGKL